MQLFSALTVLIQNIEALMGHGECRREVHPVCDDLDVACRFAGGGTGQSGVELTDRSDARREPALTTEGGGNRVVVPGGEVVVDPIGVHLESALDRVAPVVEHKDDRL